MSNYYFHDNQFVIEQYDIQKTFSSFLPGLAGKRGVPLWAFYVNRGQGIASFGIENKDRQILEFSPAIKSYQTVATDGFRTFVKVNGTVVEFFGETDNPKRTMSIKRSEFTIEEVNDTLGLTMQVTYFGLPNENIAALVRLVRFINHSNKPVELEVLDGLSQLLPTGVHQHGMKMLANLMRSWMEVYHLDDDVGFYRMRSSSSDSAEVVEHPAGNFYVSTIDDAIVRPIVDPYLVFGMDSTKRRARFFEDNDLATLLAAPQVTANKIPVGFTAVTKTLGANQSFRINTVIGHLHAVEDLLERKDTIALSSYLDKQRQVANDVVEDILNDVTTKTANPLFDDYIKQNYLDNILRGGYPMVLPGDESDHVYHLYSRRHGDLERDYNYFTIAPEFYSQGNGSFRDVCQNRRSDTLIHPKVGTFNIKMFGSFLQADGFNPLSIDGSTFELLDKADADLLANQLFDGDNTMRALLKGTFTPGSIINTLVNNDIPTAYSDEAIFNAIFPLSKQRFEARFGEGYWIDHWTYILDLVESYQAIYPDRIHEALFSDPSYKYFQSPIYVLPRDEKICLTSRGDIRRYGSVLEEDPDVLAEHGIAHDRANWLKDDMGNTIEGTLFEKLFVLAVNKVASLDPSGMGIEMEANKPGWNDAMNGMPGLFGSGISETIELKRLVQYLATHFDPKTVIKTPQEFNVFVQELHPILEKEMNDYKYWDRATTAKETYRAAIRYATSGLDTLDSSIVQAMLESMNRKLEMSLAKALRMGHGVYPTYLVHTVTAYDPILIKGSPKIGHYGLPVVTPRQFDVRALPFYLEAPARALKIMKNTEAKLRMYQQLKASNVYDHELKFYKTSEFLDDESNEIGRGRSFTKGWQERESNFLHMTYKYLYGLLKAGMYNEFFNEIKTNLTIYMDPETYGRSTLENSSFIASSVNPDPQVRGQGYVARLSGSTAEMISIWATMMAGSKPFTMTGKTLKLSLHPILSKDMFLDGIVEFTFLGSIRVTYVNESNIDTFDPSFHITKYDVDGIVHKTIEGDLAEQVRNGHIQHIIAYF